MRAVVVVVVAVLRGVRPDVPQRTRAGNPGSPGDLSRRLPEGRHGREWEGVPRAIAVGRSVSGGQSGFGGVPLGLGRRVGSQPLRLRGKPKSCRG